MAPSNVFSYLRPHHKRTHSHPSSPEPQLAVNSITNPAPLHEALSTTPTSAPRFTSSDTSTSHASSPLGPFAPSLPALSRVGRRSNPPDPQKVPFSAAKDHGYNKRHSMKEDTLQANTSAGSRGQEQVKPNPDPAILPDGWRDSVTGRNAPTGLRTKGQSAQNAAQNGSSPAHASLSTLAEDTAPTNSSFTASQISLASTTLPEKEKHSSAIKIPGPSQSSKSGKRALNLLNPMSLLLRRRSAQALQNLSEESLVSHRNHVVPAMSLGDDFDPSIRGNIVHDFSAPKPRRTQSYDMYTFPQGRRKDNRDDESPSKRDRSHTPVFKEEFDAPEADDKKRQSAIRAEELANHDFLARNAVPSESGHEQSFPPFGRYPAQPPLLSRRSVPPPLDQMPVREDATGLATVPEASPRSPDSDTKRSNATKTPPLSRSRATSVADSSFQSGLPTHMTSRASRFSFQIGGVDSAAQEKLLEEKHRARFAQKSKENIGDDFGDAEEDMYDYNNMDDDFGGYEEEIPTIGVEDDGFGGDERPGLSPGLSSLDFNSMVVGSHVDDVLGPTPGTAETGSTGEEKSQPTGSRASGAKMQVGYSEHVTMDADSNGAGGMRISLQPDDDSEVATGDHKPFQFDDDDDLYFDDGLIGEPDPPAEGDKFDESVFDDPEHHLYERRPPSLKPLPAQRTDTMPPESAEGQSELVDEPAPAHALAPHPSVLGKKSAFQATEPFDFNSSSYHNALADALNKAEAEGRFVRKNSIATTDVSFPSREDGAQGNGENSNQANEKESESQHPTAGFMPDSGRGSCQVDTLNSGSFDDMGDLDSPFSPNPYDVGFDDYGDYDSGLEDDPIIAAANAEALANDYDGEYGSEFGFYASAYANSQAGPGGYFGPRGVDALGRSASGRYAVREPNLTPITERSEYSARNSFIGLGHFAGPSSAPGSQAQNSAGAIPSPGFAQFARTSPYGFPPGTEDDFSDYDMSLEQLMRLRKGAFGGAGSPAGSTASSPRNSSPMNFFSGGFSGRGSSPVATRTKSSLDTFPEGLQEVEESPDEASSTQAQASSASQSDANRVDLSPDISSADDGSPQHASAPVQIYGVPPQRHSGYDAFLPDHPGAIPLSVPASAISTNSNSSCIFSHPSAVQSARNSTSCLAVSPTLSVAAPILSPTAGPTSHPQQPPPPYSPLDPQKFLPQHEPDAHQIQRSTLHLPIHQHTRTHSQPLPQLQPLLSPLYSPTPTNDTTTSTTSTSAIDTSSTATTPANLSPQPPQCISGFSHPHPLVELSAAAAAAAAPPPHHRRGKSSSCIISNAPPMPAPTSQPQGLPSPPTRPSHSRTNSASADHVTYVRERVVEDDHHYQHQHPQPPYVGGRSATIAAPGTSSSGEAAATGGGVRDGRGYFPDGAAKGAEREVYRWVLERRRTSGTGEMELVGREVVESGRI
ncbi:hypothetical protein BKA81DRAFT_402917 [Phyllosticta paracitricarpa]|uniref:Uncharacterized protein n=1 Tax=Phyllosticta paracitricarpa TaxID=2016321 RepID=A0ABR1NFE8_9PEZI